MRAIRDMKTIRTVNLVNINNDQKSQIKLKAYKCAINDEILEIWTNRNKQVGVFFSKNGNIRVTFLKNHSAVGATTRVYEEA